RDISYAKTVIDMTPPREEVFQVDREGVFFAGQVFDALRHVDALIRDATERVTIIDGYASEKVLELLSAKNQRVSAEIVMKMSQATPSLKALAEAFKAQYGGLAIRMSDAFHDRFVIVDDSQFYHFGTSLKDAGRKGFMFSRIEESTVVSALRE